VVGPDDARFSPEALHVLLGEPFSLSPSSDRTGSRLVGPPLPRLDADDLASAPMVAGAIEVPASGDPIVLGPDHPTTGGYPVLAVIVRADLGRFHARPVGATIRFTRT
jgi:allophanate hydrolase subunit 2